MNRFDRLFDNVGRTITSAGAVIFFMLITIGGMMLFSHTQFSQIFPPTMVQWEKDAATWFMALAFDSAILITTTHARFLKSRYIPTVLAICQTINVMFFIDAFNATDPTLIIVQRWFFALLAGIIQYIYTDLFCEVWQERVKSVQVPVKVEQLEAELQQMAAQLQQVTAQLQHSAATCSTQLKELQHLREIEKKYIAERTCPHCSEVLASPASLRTHIGHCKKSKA
jgi:uncharacterized membrane protein (UPF0136 family)